jgi:hypothetical protein
MTPMLEKWGEAWRMCFSKVRYRTETRAQRHASAKGLRAYLCPHCRYWHLTSCTAK